MKKYLSCAVLRRLLSCLACVVLAVMLHTYYLKVDQEWNPDNRLLTLYHSGDIPVGLVATGKHLFETNRFWIDQPWLFGLALPIVLLFFAAYIFVEAIEKNRKAVGG